jgi:hypothetical protein
MMRPDAAPQVSPQRWAPAMRLAPVDHLFGLFKSEYSQLAFPVT